VAAFDWGAMLVAGVNHLKIPVRDFWNLTPAELMFLISPTQTSGSLGRTGFETLLAHFPDDVGENNERSQ